MERFCPLGKINVHQKRLHNSPETRVLIVLAPKSTVDPEHIHSILIVPHFDMLTLFQINFHLKIQHTVPHNDKVKNEFCN